MSRKEYLFYGGLMVAIAAVVVSFYPPIAGVFLIVGLSILLYGERLNRKYGKNRPSRKEIDAMSVSEFKERSRDPKFTQYINYLYKKPFEKPFNPDDF